ncbi:TonB-dependent receptor [Ohtaekwangia koreensis]|uniref:Iron complex outermembrane recepter protein n=1 Tax=Ohtaekwangia koreensis TaxID=688867 RepID=A0A1T5LL28_9BACT|nr:TonB-dependent receptor [Ohtaekwangia koreensis]SKC76505.1 iron complex outermembrane recepter protein [Ohtaekwangia koreensis]
MKPLYLFLFLLFLSPLMVCGQSGSIRGVVKTSDGNPAEFVNIAIEGTSKGDIADKNGKFEIRNVAPGNYILVASFIGLENTQQPVEVKPGETVTVDFILKENTKQLEEVIISGRATLNKEDNYVAKMPLRKMENPQVYNSVSSEILKQQAITSYDDAFRNIPGVFRTWESTGRDGDGASYFALRGLEGQPALVNGLPGITNGNLDPANVEEIQVMKGPSATLFGANATAYTSYGGVINTITKKPYFTSGGEIGYNIGSFGLNRITADINAPLSQQNKVAIRINTAYHTEGSFQDAGFKKSFFLAPTLAYEVNDRLKILIVTEILEEERAVAPVFFHSNRAEPLTFKTIGELNLDTKLSFTSNDLTIKNPRANLQAQMVYKLSDQWSSQTVISRGSANSNGYYSYIWADAEGDNDFGQYFTYVKESRTTTDIQQNFNGDFKLGSVRNRLLIGLDYFTQEAVNNGLGYVFIRNVTPQGGENFISPDTGEELAPVYLSRASIDNLLAATPVNNSKLTNNTYGAYISNVMTITPAITILAGVRADYFDSDADDFDQFALSPKFGIVYQPVLEKVSVFANYQNAFNNVAPMQVADEDGNNQRLKTFDPEQANQWEVGVKTNVLKDRLFAMVSYYDIQIKNKVIGDVNNFYNYIQSGKVESKGYELEVTANLFSGFSLIAGYSHNETKNKEGFANDFYSEAGRAPGGQGPQDQVNVWATYKFSSGNLQDIGFGLGGNYASKYRVIDNSITGVFDLPSYTVLNASVFYNPERFRFAVNVNNALDEEYYIGYWSVNPQKPRNIVISMAYTF